VRWSDASGLTFGDLQTGNPADLDLEMLNTLSALPDTSTIDVVITYKHYPTSVDLAGLASAGITGGTIFRRLPMVMVDATKQQIGVLAAYPAIRSIYANRTLTIFDRDSRALIGADEAEGDLALALPGGVPATGAGVTIATLDTGVDATHPDLPFGTKVVQNVRLNSATGTGIGFVYPTFVAGVPNTDLVMGHGTFVSSVAAGSGAASSGRYRGVAPDSAFPRATSSS
jgi:serine protease AprX